MRRLTLIPVGWPCTLAEARPGHFLFDGQHVGFKSEYGQATSKPEAFNEAGEYYQDDGKPVQPLEPKWEEYESDE
jgi:hypothetical protein